MPDRRPFDLDLFRQAWMEALELTNGLPAAVPDRTEVDRLTGCLRGPVELLAAELEAAIEAELEDSSDRETARWLLIRTRRVLDEGQGPNHRTAAVHVEDLALSCRALATLRHQQLCAPAMSGWHPDLRQAGVTPSPGSLLLHRLGPRGWVGPADAVSQALD